jgi:hypothetical protein
LRAGGDGPMEKAKIRREIVAVFIDSPLYFTIPLKKRIEFIRFYSQQPIYSYICELNEHKMLGKSVWKELRSFVTKN